VNVRKDSTDVMQGKKPNGKIRKIRLLGTRGGKQIRGGGRIGVLEVPSENMTHPKIQEDAMHYARNMGKESKRK